MTPSPFHDDGPIIRSLLDTDFYYFTMGQSVLRRFSGVPVTYTFRCRTPDVYLGQWIKEADLRRELDHIRSLRFTRSELHYLKGTYEYGKDLPGHESPMFGQDYISFLAGLEFPPYQLLYENNGTITLQFSGPAEKAIYWETPSMSVVNELYYRAKMASMTNLERAAVWASSVQRLAEKVAKLRARPDVVFAEAGARRRVSRKWQEFMVTMLAENFKPEQMRGTSNVKLAMDLGLLPMGTYAHQWYSLFYGTMHNSDEELRASHNAAIRAWHEDWGKPLSVLLGDMYGSDFFFRDLTDEQVAFCRGFRGDSGDLFAFGEKGLKRCEKAGVPAREKVFVPSDGLDVNTAIAMTDRFAPHYGLVSNMIGTFYSNDTGIFKPLSLATKLTRVNGHGVVKLSDNRAKASGTDADVTRATEIFDQTAPAWIQPEC